MAANKNKRERREIMCKLYVYYESIFDDKKLCCTEVIVPYDETIQDVIKHYKTGGRIVITEPITELLGV